MTNSVRDFRRRLVGAPFAPAQISALQAAIAPAFYGRLTAQISLGGITLDATAVRSDFAVELDPGRAYEIEMLLVGSVAATAGLQFDFNGGSVDVALFRGVSLFYVTAAPVPGATIVTALNTAQSNAAAGQGALFKGVLVTGAGGGVLVPRINRAGAGTTTIDAGSYLKAIQM